MNTNFHAQILSSLADDYASAALGRDAGVREQFLLRETLRSVRRVVECQAALELRQVAMETAGQERELALAA